jgi:perosamine synthetase
VGGGADFSVTSFHARKIMTCGEGGMIFTNDAEAAAKLRRLKHQGMSLTDYERRAGLLGDETYGEVGYNFRLTDIQAAMLVTQFERLEETIAKRAQIAEWYCRLIDPTQVDLPHVGVGVSPNWQSFQVTIAGIPNLQTRDALIADLRANGIPAKRGVMASHLEPAYIDTFPVHLPVTEAAVVANLTLPMHPRLTLAECELVASKLSASMDRILK